MAKAVKGGPLKELLYQGVDWIAGIHDQISKWNDKFETTLSDKQLHFLVIGVLGILLICLLHPLFRHLAKTNHVMVITWFYVFTLILVITFAIEIGQRIYKKGDMEFVDIVSGVGGFVAMFAVFALIRSVIIHISRAIRRRKAASAEKTVPKAAPADPLLKSSSQEPDPDRS